MAIVTQYHKDTDTTYVYESTSYWDAEKKQSRSKRKVIGKLDPVTGEIIPTGKRGRKPKDPGTQSSGVSPAQYAELQSRLVLLQKANAELSSKTGSLQQELQTLRQENRKLKASLRKITDICGSV